MAGVTFDPVAPLARFAAASGIAFPLLADRESRIIRKFDLADGGVAGDAPWYGVAVPMLVVLDADGVVTHRFSTRDRDDRPDPDAVMNVLRRAAGASR